jgi:hypothetical protein
MFSLFSVMLASTMISTSKVASLSLLPVKKVPNSPVLVVVDPHTKTRVHLVGVSHGTKASASLVQNTIQSIKPSAVVLGKIIPLIIYQLSL